MADLAFTSAKRETSGDPVVFTLDGVSFFCRGSVNSMALLALADADDSEASGIATLQAVYRFLRTLVVAEDWSRFRAHCTEHETPTETLIDVIRGVLPQVVGRPTERPSSLPVQPVEGSPATTADSSSPAIPAASAA